MHGGVECFDPRRARLGQGGDHDVRGPRGEAGAGDNGGDHGPLGGVPALAVEEELTEA